MQEYGKWKVLRELGRGGQGTVYLVCDTSQSRITCSFLKELEYAKKRLDSFRNESRATHPNEDRHMPIPPQFAKFFVDSRIDIQLGALKTLPSPGDWQREPETALVRFRNELSALRECNHPNVLQIMDDEPDKWFVATYFRRGPLHLSIRHFCGNPHDALVAFRDLADGVGHLHAKGIVHRDIKPENVFLSDDERLVLGDMGLVISSDSAHTRVTDLHANVGSRDWMPPWAIGQRVEEVQPSFDLFSLGKILWSLMTGAPRCPNVLDATRIEAACVDQRVARAINRVISACVVAREKECLSDVAELLELVDDAIHECRSPVPSVFQKMACHALSRPGGQFLFSAEWPSHSKRPICNPRTNWRVMHPRGPLSNFPGLHPSGSLQLAEIEEDQWEGLTSFWENDTKLNYRLIKLPEPRSHDNYLECTFPAIPFSLARYFQFRVAIDSTATFSMYVRFGGEARWLCYRPGLGSPSQEQEQGQEFLVPVREWDSTTEPTIITRDLHRDIERTFGKDALNESITGLRLRGAFKLQFARIS